MSKRIVILPDTQMPYDARKELKAVIGFIGDVQPDELIHIGDLLDNPTSGRWTKGYAEEFAKQLKGDVRQAKERLLEPIRAVYDGPFGIHEGNHDCLSTLTKAVTRRGFVHVDDLTSNDEVMSVDDSGNTIWQKIEEVVRYPFDGEMISVGGRDLAATVTPNHRLVGLSDKSNKWVEYTPDEFSATRVWAYSAGHGKTEDLDMSDNEIRLAAWAITDSCRSKAGRWSFYQSGPEAERIRLLLKQMDLPAREYVRNRGITEIDGKVLNAPPKTQFEFHVGKNQWLDNLVPDKHRLPEWAFDLSERQARVFLDEIVFCDGSEKPSGARMIYVCRSDLRDDLRLLCVQNGIRSSVTEYRPGHFRLNLCDRNVTGIYKADFKRVPYTGEVWCLRVPNGRFFIELDGRIHLTGNSRPRDYLTKYAPALVEYENQFHIENLLDFDGFGIDLLPEFYDVAPGWLSTHGHRGQISLSRIAGNTAMGAARKFGKSVVMGHTHRAGILSETRGYGGRVTSQLTGMEVGNLMNMRQAQYLKSGTGNWQQAFGVLTVDGRHVKPELVPIAGGRFSFDGHTWEV